MQWIMSDIVWLGKACFFFLQGIIVVAFDVLFREFACFRAIWIEEIGGVLGK